MAYAFPEGLKELEGWLRRHGADVSSYKTERQAAYFAQTLAGTKFKFPNRGQSCFPVLRQIQSQLPEAPKGNMDPDAKKPRGKKRGRGRKDSVSPAIEAADHSSRSHPFVIYTDGGCEPNPGQGGWGFCVYRDGKEVHCAHGGAEQSTNNIMEITAALEAVTWCQAESLNPNDVIIHSDSQYVVKGCMEWRFGWKKNGWRRGKEKPLLNAELWQAIDAAFEGYPVEIAWVRGHVGIEGNERADELASIGREPYSSEQTDELTAQYRDIMRGDL